MENLSSDRCREDWKAWLKRLIKDQLTASRRINGNSRLMCNKDLSLSLECGTSPLPFGARWMQLSRYFRADCSSLETKRFSSSSNGFLRVDVDQQSSTGWNNWASGCVSVKARIASASLLSKRIIVAAMHKKQKAHTRPYTYEQKYSPFWPHEHTPDD